jgi:hypothetical protein
MAELRATPYANPLTGLSNDVIQGLLGYMKDKRRTQQLQGLAGLLESTGIPKTVERAAYAESPAGLLNALTNVNRANVPLLKSETADALLTLSPVPSGANKAAMAVGRAGERYAEKVVPQIMERGGLPAEMVQAMGTNTRSLLDVYHGTPHTLPPTAKNPLGEFDASKIGTGEGAQAYGHGIYVAENPAVAKDYTFLEQNWFDTSEATYKGKPIDYWYDKAQKDKDLAYRTKNKALEKDATAREAYWENIMTHSHPEKVLKTMTDPDYGWDEATKYAKSIDLTKFKGIPDAGNLYKVDLPDEMIAKMLDWDKPLSQQHPDVQAAFNLSKYSPDSPIHNMTGMEAYVNYGKRFGNPTSSAPETAKAFSDLGITGIRYLDAGSRDIGKGTSNFVIFPSKEKSMTILERNGLLADQFQALPEEKKREVLSLLE